jgi:hypothetical protein
MDLAVIFLAPLQDLQQLLQLVVVGAVPHKVLIVLPMLQDLLVVQVVVGLIPITLGDQHPVVMGRQVKVIQEAAEVLFQTLRLYKLLVAVVAEPEHLVPQQ